MQAQRLPIPVPILDLPRPGGSAVDPEPIRLCSFEALVHLERVAELELGIFALSTAVDARVFLQD